MTRGTKASQPYAQAKFCRTYTIIFFLYITYLICNNNRPNCPNKNCRNIVLSTIKMVIYEFLHFKCWDFLFSVLQMKTFPSRIMHINIQNLFIWVQMEIKFVWKLWSSRRFTTSQIIFLVFWWWNNWDNGQVCNGNSKYCLIISVPR